MILQTCDIFSMRLRKKKTIFENFSLLSLYNFSFVSFFSSAIYLHNATFFASFALGYSSISFPFVSVKCSRNSYLRLFWRATNTINRYARLLSLVCKYLRTNIFNFNKCKVNCLKATFSVHFKYTTFLFVLIVKLIYWDHSNHIMR